MDAILFPIHHGILGFVGFDVIEPFIVYGPSRMSPADRAAELDRYRMRVLTLKTAPTILQTNTSLYDGMVLKHRSPAAAGE
jgi:NAD(P)H dehydrogenase (quinone)